MISAALTALGALTLAACPAFERGVDPVPDIVIVDEGGGGGGGVSGSPGGSGGQTGGAGGGVDVPTTDEGGDTPTVDVEPDVPAGPSYANEVYPILQDECGGGDCHEGGDPRPFFLSGDPDDDYAGIADLVNVDNPAASKLLKTGTGESEHSGGPALKFGSDDYELVLAWIAAGAGQN